MSTTTLQYQDHLIESIERMYDWLVVHIPGLHVDGFIVDQQTYDIIFDLPFAVHDGGTIYLHGYPIFNIHDYKINKGTSLDVVDDPLIIANDTAMACQARPSHFELFMLFDRFVASLRNGNTSLDNVTW